MYKDRGGGGKGNEKCFVVLRVVVVFVALLLFLLFFWSFFGGTGFPSGPIFRAAGGGSRETTDRTDTQTRSIEINPL